MLGVENVVPMADEMDGIARGDVLAYLLAKDEKQPQDEPLIAANIHEQLQHMGLSTWSISVLRRLRDAVGRLSPDRVLEVGASIGHRTAWLLDDFERKERSPKALTLVEQGGKFGVILQRLLQRYEALNLGVGGCGEARTTRSRTSSMGAGVGDRCRVVSDTV